jgi:hypothetical protein
VASALGLGLVEGKKFELPHIKQIGVAGTYGLAAWLIGRFTRNKIIQHLATGLLAVGAYQLGFSLMFKGELEKAAAAKKEEVKGFI